MSSSLKDLAASGALFQQLIAMAAEVLRIHGVERLDANCRKRTLFLHSN